MLLAESLPDISGVPSDFIKNLLLCAGFGIMIFLQWRQGQSHKREISGSVETTPKKELAIKAEVETRMTAFDKGIAELKAHVDTKVKEINQAGEQRADKITMRIDNEVRAIREETEKKVAALQERIHEVSKESAAHGAQIEDLQARDHSHDMQLLNLRPLTTKPR